MEHSQSRTDNANGIQHSTSNPHATDPTETPSQRFTTLGNKKRQTENLIAFLQTRTVIDDVKVTKAKDDLVVIVRELVEVEEAVLLTETDEEEYHRVAKMWLAQKRQTELTKLAFETAQAKTVARQYMTLAKNLASMPKATMPAYTVPPLQSMEQRLAEGMSLLQLFADE
jgi:hypothetical protein